MKNIKDISSRKQSGFSLIELLVYMAILGILMTAVFISYTKTLQRTNQQASIAETKIETGVGLELLRADLEHAGFGLPWQLPATPSPYSEPAPLADVPNTPKAFSSEDTSASSLNGSDYLVIRATNAIRGITGQKWGFVGRDTNHLITVQSMSSDAFVNTDRVIVIRPEIIPGQYRQLIMDGTTYITQPTTAAMDKFAPLGTPNDPDGERYLVYGLNDDANISRPFNRTDYYINNTNVPTHCAPNTGVLVKATVNQADNNFTIMPIVDCVGDFQVVYYRDTDGDGGWDQRSDANGLNGLSAEQIRDQVKAVRCYVLTHEGNIDRTYTQPNPVINVGEVKADGVTLETGAGRAIDLSATVGADWSNYRWKIDSMAVSPKNLK